MYCTEERTGEDTARRWPSVSQGEKPHQNNLASTLILDFHPPKLWENKFLLCKPPSLWCFMMVNFMCHLTRPRGAQIFDQTLFWVFLRGCFGMRLTFKPVDLVKHIALHNVSGPHPTSWRPEENKKADLPLERIFPAWLPWNWDIRCFLSADSNWNTDSSWVFSWLAFRWN